MEAGFVTLQSRVYIKPRVLPSRTLGPQMGVHSEPRGTSSNTCLRPFPSPAACTLVGRLRSRRVAGGSRGRCDSLGREKGLT